MAVAVRAAEAAAARRKAAQLRAVEAALAAYLARPSPGRLADATEAVAGFVHAWWDHPCVGGYRWRVDALGELCKFRAGRKELSPRVARAGRERGGDE